MITGATGFVGLELSARLLNSGHDIYALIRTKTNILPSKVKQITIGDLSHLSSDPVKNLFEGIDVVIHTAARVHVMNDSVGDPLAEFRKVNLEGTMTLARQAAEAGVKRFIFISSIKVNGESTVPGQPFTADDEPRPMDPYGVSKAEAEKALLELAVSTGLEVVIVRPVLVYGPGVKANFLSLMNWLNKSVPLPLGAIRNKRSLVSIDNLVDLIITCTGHPAAVNQVFLVSDGEDLSTTELLQRVGLALGKAARLLPVPAWLISLVAAVDGKRDFSERLLGSLQVDIKKTQDLLGWIPPASIDEALNKTVQSFLQDK
jgi:UDP-glucose 4-epimerase